MDAVRTVLTYEDYAALPSGDGRPDLTNLPPFPGLTIDAAALWQ